MLHAKHLFRVLGLMAVLLVATGPAFSQSNPTTPKKSQPPLYKIALDDAFPDAKTAFEEAKKIILENYYSADITEEALYWAAIKGMLRHISPPFNPEHNKLVKPEEHEKFTQALAGKTVSIGIKASFNQKDGSLTVEEVIPSSPADGILEPFDRILRVDGETLAGKASDEVNKLLDGAPDTRVVLTVVRDIKVFDVALKRREYKVPSLKVFELPEKIAVVELKKMTENIAAELKTELERLKTAGIQKVILDLRGNPGGSLKDTLKLADLFLAPKSVTLRIVTHATDHQRVVTSDPDVYQLQLAVLVNHNTASSCEVLTAALKDHKIAKVIGTKTYGKAFIDRQFPLPNKFQVQITTGIMYSPLGKTWYLNGIVPDIEVKQEPQVYNELAKVEPAKRLDRDEPLASAYNYLKNL